MNRRQILKTGMMATGFAVLLPSMATSQEASPPPVSEATLTVISFISDNHGHQFTLTPVEVVQLVRSTKISGPVTVDIHGQGNHGHLLQLSHDNLLVLLVEGMVELESSMAGTHKHTVQIKLEVLGTNIS